MTGTQIENYLIQQKLGEGGMGTVYRALDTNLDRVVAIKVLNTDLAGDASVLERFRSEARAQANLNHPNIATLYSFFVHQGSPMMVMEYVDGESMQQLVERRGLIPAEEAIPLFRQALLGVGAAHRLGIVHRDIKPSNLMLNRAGVVKVMDFGIAKAIAMQRGLTRTGVHVGTVFYMSPEQIKGERVDTRSDIYALGVTLYQLTTANVPFASDSEFQILNGHINTPPPLPSSFYPYLPKGLENIILKALEKSPDDRFQTVDEFSAALEHPEAWENFRPRSAAAQGDAPKNGMAATAGLGQSSSVNPRSVPPTVGLNRPATPPPLSDEFVAPSTIWKARLVVPVALLLCVSAAGALMISRGKSNSSAAVRHPGSQQVSLVQEPPATSTASEKTVTSVPAPAGEAAPAADDSRKLRAANSSNASEETSLAPERGREPIPVRRRARISAEQAAGSEVQNPYTGTQGSSGTASNSQSVVSSDTASASAADLDEARQRFIRLRSKAMALKGNLADLRRRLAYDQSSVRSDVLESETNMDSYMLEADRAIQAGNAKSAQDNMNMAEHEAKKIAAVVGG